MVINDVKAKDLYFSVIRGHVPELAHYEKEKFDEVLDIVISALNEIGRGYETGEYFIPDLLASGDAAQTILNFFRSKAIACTPDKSRSIIILGTVAGDQHEIGKNIVKIYLTSSGYDVMDLGVNVKTLDFFKTLKETDSKILLLSSLTSFSLNNLKNTVEFIKSQKETSHVKIFIGGLAVNGKVAKDCGADGFYPNPKDLVNVIKTLGD